MAVNEARVKEIIVEQLGVSPEQVKPEHRFIDDLGADSLDTVELVMEFEKAFNPSDSRRRCREDCHGRR